MAADTKSHEYRLQQIVDERHETAWTNPPEQDPRETLGMVVAAFYHWTPEDIAVAFIAALEDANAHTACQHIEAYLKEKGWNLTPVPRG